MRDGSLYKAEVFKMPEDILKDGWYVQIADGGVARDRKVITRDAIPEEPDREYYATWIGEKSGQYWTPWLIWDVDVEEPKLLQTALGRTRDFVQKLQLTGVPDEAIRVIFSTRRGFHVYLDSRVIGLKPSEKLHAEIRNFSKVLMPDCDESLYTKNHIIGVPNSLHRKTGLYYSLLSLEELAEFTLEQMATHARRPHEFEPQAEAMSPVKRLCEIFAESNHKEPVKFFPSLAEIRQKLRTPPEAWYGVAKGGRDRAMYELALRYSRLGLTIEEAYVLVCHANNRNNPRMPEESIRKKVNSAFSKEGVQIG